MKTKGRAWRLGVLVSAGVGLLGVSLFGAGEVQGFRRVVTNGETITNVSRVTVGTAGKVVIIHGGSGTQVDADQLPPEFLKSWGIGEATLNAARQQATEEAQDALERAVKGGMFREVEGIVYDLRKSQPGWFTFSRAKIIQHIGSSEVLAEVSLPGSKEIQVVHLKHLPGVEFLSDSDYVSFTARLVSNYSYRNRARQDRTVRSYDAGRMCDWSEIPDAILAQGKTSAPVVTTALAVNDPVARLPAAGELRASGSGFFITEDGYLLTNDHVVKGARRIRVRTGAGDFTARVIRRNESDDLALLKVSGRFKALALNLVKEAALGDEVFTIGYPNVQVQGLQPKYTDGKISSLAGLKDDPSEYQISVPVQPGNSGGALVDTKGHVVGVIVARINDLRVLVASGSLPQNVNYAVKASTVREFLKPAKELDEKLKSSSYELSRDQAIKAAEEAAAMVLCYE